MDPLRTSPRARQAPSTQWRYASNAGGKNQGDACAAFAYHGFNGLEADVVEQMADWILAPAQ